MEEVELLDVLVLIVMLNNLVLLVFVDTYLFKISSLARNEELVSFLAKSCIGLYLHMEDILVPDLVDEVFVEHSVLQIHDEELSLAVSDQIASRLAQIELDMLHVVELIAISLANSKKELSNVHLFHQLHGVHAVIFSKDGNLTQVLKEVSEMSS